MADFLNTEAREDGYMSDEIPLASPISRGASKSRYRRRVLTSSESEPDQSDIEALEGLKKTTNRDQPAKEAPIGPTDLSMVMEELKKTNAIISALARKVKSTDQRTMAIEEQLRNSDSSSISTPKRPRKRVVPDAVRVRISS